MEAWEVAVHGVSAAASRGVRLRVYVSSMQPSETVGEQVKHSFAFCS